MKRLLLFFALCSSLGAWAQTAEFVSSSDGKTLTIKASGDLTTNPSTSYVSGYKFTAAAVGEVYTSPNDLNNNSVSAGQTVILANQTYYLASKSHTQIFTDGVVDGTYAYNVNTEAHTFTANNGPILVSNDGGTTIIATLNNGDSYTYEDSYTFYAVTATFSEIADIKAFVRDNSDYFESA